MLRMKTVPLFGKDARRVKRLYQTAFPVEQRVPFWSLRLRSGMNGMEIVAYYDQDVFCGFANLVKSDDAVYIYYLAVDENLRGKGYGGQILDDLKRRHAGKTIALDIEATDPSADNPRQRAARRAFYLNNGFVSSGYGFKDGGLFEILVFGEKLESPGAYASLIDRLAFGLTHTVVRPMKEIRHSKKHSNSKMHE
ncbi:MAG: GNAT family N-acetyltransferase [Slackia sp.]|nr:GNAT family N-acetyltransferase [Slackia sp.]